MEENKMVLSFGYNHHLLTSAENAAKFIDILKDCVAVEVSYGDIITLSTKRIGEYTIKPIAASAYKAAVVKHKLTENNNNE